VSFLFVIVMEALSRMLSTVVNESSLSCFSVGPRHLGLVNISHLQNFGILWSEGWPPLLSACFIFMV
jgi:hypothetical protein